MSASRFLMTSLQAKNNKKLYSTEDCCKRVLGNLKISVSQKNLNERFRRTKINKVITLAGKEQMEKQQYWKTRGQLLLYSAVA